MSKTLEFVTLDVFTDTPYQGNPLAIVLVPPKHEISDTKLQTIAREFNLSETVFLYLNEDGDQVQEAFQTPKALEWRIRIFMTDCELPFAGHPTIGTAVYALTQLNNIGATTALLHCPAGTIKVDFNAVSQTAKISIPHNVHLHTSDRYTAEEVRRMQPGLTDDSQLKAFEVFSPVAGMNFLNVELSSLEALAAIAPTPLKPTLKLDDGWNPGFSATLFYVKTGNGQLRTRMVAGTLEDPATGSASCGLGAMLALKDKSNEATTLDITQGVEMGRSSNIGVTTTLSENCESVQSIQLFGTAVEVMKGSLRI
jgi:PhzF family phenazine biosynthesis protein